MREILEIQRKAFLEEGEPSLNQRIDRLKRCIALIETHDEKIINALNNDFKNRSKGEILTSEISQSVRNLNFTIKKLKKWMKPQSRPSSFMANMLGSKSILKPSPLGTVGVIAPWNFPVGMVFYPAASIFAAGNRIMAKPSELTPNTADVIKEGVEKYFDESEFSVTLGGPEVGAEFSALPFDHLLYTGSGRVGKKILAAAANNLVPTTLELGGKSPTIISDGMDLNLIAKRIMFVKTLNAGQICLSPDYIFIKRGLENDLINALKETFNDFFTEKNQDDYTSMVNENHFKRMDQYIQDAKEKGAVVTDLAPIDNPDNNIMSTKVLLNVNDEMLVMQEEIFGPLLPVMVYDDLSEVVNYVNDHDHPLGLYFFGDDQMVVQRILHQLPAPPKLH